MWTPKSKPSSQRSKSGRQWPQWLRDLRLFKVILRIGIVAYRLWRWWHALTEDPTDD